MGMGPAVVEEGKAGVARDKVVIKGGFYAT